MPGISIHVVDISQGRVAQGMTVSLWALDPERLITRGTIDATGLLDEAVLQTRFPRGRYEARFEVGAYFPELTGSVPFLDVVHYRFGINDPEQHYHLPMKLTAWGLSCFRGGA
jgi:5-hydroxyisourate hydrolase